MRFHVNMRSELQITECSYFIDKCGGDDEDKEIPFWPDGILLSTVQSPK